MNIFDGHRCLIHQHTNGQCHARQGHDVDRLPHQIEQNYRRQNRQRNGQHHNNHASPVAQKQQHHQARQQGPQNAFRGQVFQ